MAKARKNTEPASAVESPSKSAKKRESTALQKLGEELVKLKIEECSELNLPADLLEALAQYDRMPDHESRRRQRQFIGKLMRQFDTAEIALALSQRHAVAHEQNVSYRKAEQTRRQLLAFTGPDLQVLLDEILQDDSSYKQDFLELIERAKQDNPDGKRAQRELFKKLADLYNT